MSYEDREFDDYKDEECCVPAMKINCNLEVNFENKNKIIYLYPDKLQYFTASAICCAGGETIEIEYTGCNAKCIHGEVFICGHLGYYKIVNTGIIFMPKHNLPKSKGHCKPTDILHFKAKGRCHEEVDFVVVFTIAGSEDCNHHCCK